jgi:hypothetical protein
LEEALHHLKQLQMTVAKVDRRLQEAIYAVESALNGHQ